ncbi:hypothetical protein F5051DRAFT_394840 [Lentinula edodes]|nr:hypothetical protein F5051DRAFT_394840 [Lentinula edodes]
MARTRKNKSKRKNAASGGDPEAPTEIEWESMEIYRKFIVTENAIDGGEDVDHPFEVGDCVSILPSDPPAGYGIEDGPALPIEAMWLGLIKDIRMRYKGGEQEAWSRVQWFFSGADVGNTIQNFDTSHLGENERLLSDHCDLVHSSTLDDVVPMRCFYFDPTYISSVERNTTMQQIFTQREIRAAGSRTENGSIYPDVYYRYEFKVKSKHIFPKVSQFNCFSPKVSSNSSRSRSSSRSKSNRRTVPTLNNNVRPKPQQLQDICFSESLYSPPDSERARRIGRQVADLVREAHIILEDGITQILKSASESRLRNEFKKNSTQAGDMARTTRNIGRTTRPRTGTAGTSNADSGIPESATQGGSLNKTANQLASKMQEAIFLEDTLAMHICARAQCTAPRGKAWHRSCLIRDQAPSEKLVGGGAEDFADNDETLLHFESWILRDARHRGRTHPISSPSFDHVMARWKSMGHSRQLEVERMLQLLCTIPPGYENPNIGSEGIYEFPVLFAVGIPNNAKPSAEGKSAASGKRKARTSEQEQLKVSADSLEVNLDKGSKSPKKQRRSLHVSDADKLNIELESTPRYSKDGDEDYIPRIMHTLSSLLAPELICLASQPMVRGGVPSISSLSSRNHSFAFAGTSPIFSSESLFGEALRTTITGNIFEVARARIAVYKALDEMSLQPKKLDSSSAIDVDITKKEPLIVPQEWSDYVLELEGREWLFELSDSMSTSKRREKRFASSKDKTRETVLTRTHNFLRHWQAHRRSMMLCPTCRFDI